MRQLYYECAVIDHETQFYWRKSSPVSQHTTPDTGTTSDSIAPHRTMIFPRLGSDGGAVRFVIYYLVKDWCIAAVAR